MRDYSKNYFWHYVIAIVYIGIITNIIIGIRNRYFRWLIFGNEADSFMSIGRIIDGAIIAIAGTVFGFVIPYVIYKLIIRYTK